MVVQQLLFGAMVDARGDVLPLPTRTAWALCRKLGCTPYDLSATSKQLPRTLIFIDKHPCFRLRLRKQQLTYNTAVLDMIFGPHKSSAGQGEQLRLRRLLNAEQPTDTTFPLGELAFEGARYLQALSFALGQAASAVRDVWAAATHMLLLPPAPQPWRNEAPPSGGLSDVDARAACFPARGLVADPARHPEGVLVQHFNEQLASSAAQAPGATEAELEVVVAEAESSAKKRRLHY